MPGRDALLSPPEKLRRALLLQVLSTIRSARLLMEQRDDNLLFRGFVGLSMDDKVGDHSVFSKNQERFLGSDLAAAFFGRIKAPAATAGLLSDEHFTVDSTLIETWASLKSFRPKDAPPASGGGGRKPEVDFHVKSAAPESHARLKAGVRQCRSEKSPGGAETFPSTAAPGPGCQIFSTASDPWMIFSVSRN